MKRSEVIRLRGIVEKAAVSLDDKTASEAATLFPSLKGDGSLVAHGTRVNWRGTIKRAANNLWDTPENNPDNAPTLWDDLAYKDGYRILTGSIPATNPVQVDECCWYKDKLYKNILGVPSVYLPDEYPTGWELVTI